MKIASITSPFPIKILRIPVNEIMIYNSRYIISFYEVDSGKNLWYSFELPLPIPTQDFKDSSQANIDLLLVTFCLRGLMLVIVNV